VSEGPANPGPGVRCNADILVYWRDILVSTVGLTKGRYHAIVRADNREPLSGLPMSALYYDVDLEVN
jgi:hypothetical protein